MLTPLMKTISHILIIAMIHLCWLTSYGWAEMVGTQASLKHQPQVQVVRQQLLDLLNRQDVFDELDKYGISKKETVARIKSLTGEEIIELSHHIESLPAGGYDPFSFILVVIYAVTLYPIMVIGKAISCIFSDCEAKGGAAWVFRLTP